MDICAKGADRFIWHKIRVDTSVGVFKNFGVGVGAVDEGGVHDQDFA